MKDKKLIRLTLILSILGLVSLSIIADYSEPKSIKIISAEENIDRTVIISGKINNFISKPTVTLFNLVDNTGKIKAVSFQDISWVKKCSEAEVTGDIALYKGQLEIIVDSIKCY